MPQIRLTCLSKESAAIVVAECGRFYGAHDGDAARQDGSCAVISYTNPQWPVNLAYWAEEQGYATTQAVASVLCRA